MCIKLVVLVILFFIFGKFVWVFLIVLMYCCLIFGNIVCKWLICVLLFFKIVCLLLMIWLIVFNLDWILDNVVCFLFNLFIICCDIDIKELLRFFLI